MDNKASKSVPVVITVVIVLILSIAVGVVFVKKYVCGGRLVYLGTQDFTPADNLKLSTGKYVEHNKLYNLVLEKMLFMFALHSFQMVVINLSNV